MPRSSSSARERGRGGPDGGERDAGVGDRAPVHPERRGHRDDRPVARAPLDLLVGAAAAGPHRAGEPRPGSPRPRPPSCTGRRGNRPWRRLRSPSEPAMTTCALSAEHTAERSSAASAWASEPPIVPRFRTRGRRSPARRRRRSGSAGRAARTPAARRWRVSAPIRISPSSSADVGELVEVVDVDQASRDSRAAASSSAAGCARRR